MPLYLRTAIPGTSQEVFDYYKMNAEGMAERVKEALDEWR